jgi:dienelactone hydrolase
MKVHASPVRASRAARRAWFDGRRVAGLVAVAVVAASGAGVAAAGPDASGTSAAAIVAADYDLGVRLFRQPGLSGRFARMPIRLWGTVAAPAAPGPHPVVLVAHGAHGDNCPGEFGTWPCFGREQRNDLGLRYLVRALARSGFVAFAPDLNAAHTGGWGEVANGESLRFGQVVDATLAEIARAGTGAPTRLGIPLDGKPDLTRLALLGHSRGGMNVLAWGRGKRTVRSVFLLAPFHDPKQRIADVPATVLLGLCDGDTGLTGARYVTAAARDTARGAPVYQLTLAGANHNYYNQTLARLRADDAPTDRASCSPAKRLTAPAQQAFLARVAVDHFTVAMLDAPAVAWMTGPVGGQLYGRKVAVKRVGG